MIDFDRFWTDSNFPPGYEEEYGPPDAADAKAPPGITAEEIAAWEREHGVTLPEPLCTALGLRDGGYVRNTSIAISPLAEIVPVDDDFWEWAGLDEDEAPDRSLVFAFGDETTSGARYLMNFNARGPHGAPSVYLDHHGESTDLVNESIGGHFEAELAASDEPGVNWSEAEEGSGLEVLRERRSTCRPCTTTSRRMRSRSWRARAMRWSSSPASGRPRVRP